MNCERFETVLLDLARRQTLEAGMGERALAHAESCARCAVRLSDQQRLTAELRALASSVEEIEAPARLEAALRTAFRERTAALRRPGKVWLPRQPRWALVAAAALLLAVGGVVLLERASSPGGAGKTAVAGVVRSASSEPQAVASALPAGPVIPPAPPRKRRVTPLSAPDRELATDFIPLLYESNLSAEESAHVVRISVPRTTLASLGLPVNEDRAAEPVKADVMLGEDGVARAIRLIR